MLVVLLCHYCQHALFDRIRHVLGGSHAGVVMGGSCIAFLYCSLLAVTLLPVLASRCMPHCIFSHTG